MGIQTAFVVPFAKAAGTPGPKGEGVNRAPDDLAVRSAVAFMWGTGGSIVRIFLQLGIQVALARLLSPEVYGAFAFGVLVVGLASYFVAV